MGKETFGRLNLERNSLPLIQLNYIIITMIDGKMQCHIIIIVITQIFLRTTNVCVYWTEALCILRWDPNKYSEPNKKTTTKLHLNKLWLKCLKNRWFDKKTQAAKHVSTEDSVQHVPRYQNIHNPTPAVSNIVLSKCLKQIAGWQLWHHPKMLTVCFVPDAVNIDHSSNVM